MSEGITFGALLAGLSCSAGLGIIMLFKHNKKMWYKNVLILILIYILSIILGQTLNIFI
jgi:hypothetical protein